MRSVKLLLVTLFACLILPCYGVVRLPQLVANGMVLQRDAKVKIWGWADAGEKITINFQHKTYHAVTGQNGSWKIILQPMKAGGRILWKSPVITTSPFRIF
jgi:sialate O-acetylesterase